MTQTPAGWYPDPAPAAPGQPPTQRYWDGTAWTDHVHPAPGAAPYAPAYPSSQGGQGYPAAQGVPGATPYAQGYPGATPYAPGYPAAMPYAQGYPAAQAARPTTPDGVPLAGWWQRAGAYLLDALIVGVASSLLTLPLQMRMQKDLTDLMRRFDAGATSGNAPDPGSFMHDYFAVMGPVLMWSALTGFVLWTVYSAAFLRTKGATPGKMALGLAVRLRDRPGQLPWSAIALRVLVFQGVALLSVVPVLYLAVSWFPALDVLWASWDGKKQALHDKAARTNVVRTR